MRRLRVKMRRDLWHMRWRALAIVLTVASGVAIYAGIYTGLLSLFWTRDSIFAEQHFVMAHAVEITGVEQGDARVQRCMDGGDAFVAIGTAIHVGHAHAAEAEGGNARAATAEFALLHELAPEEDERHHGA